MTLVNATALKNLVAAFCLSSRSPRSLCSCSRHQSSPAGLALNGGEGQSRQ